MAEIAGGVVLLAGIFWAGRESTHGLGAFTEHWWCPLPLAFIVAGAVAVIAPRVLGRPPRPG